MTMAMCDDGEVREVKTDVFESIGPRGGEEAYSYVEVGGEKRIGRLVISADGRRFHDWAPGASPPNVTFVVVGTVAWGGDNVLGVFSTEAAADAFIESRTRSDDLIYDDGYTIQRHVVDQPERGRLVREEGVIRWW